MEASLRAVVSSKATPAPFLLAEPETDKLWVDLTSSKSQCYLGSTTRASLQPSGTDTFQVPWCPAEGVKSKCISGHRRGHEYDITLTRCRCFSNLIGMKDHVPRGLRPADLMQPIYRITTVFERRVV